MYPFNIVVVIVIIDSQNWTTYVFDTYCCEDDEDVVVPVAVISSIPCQQLHRQQPKTQICFMWNYCNSGGCMHNSP